MFHSLFWSYWCKTYRWWTRVSALLCPYTSYRLHVEGKAGQEQSQYNQGKKKKSKLFLRSSFILLQLIHINSIHICLFLKSMQIRYCISFCHKEISEAVLPPGCGVCLVSPTQFKKKSKKNKPFRVRPTVQTDRWLILQKNIPAGSFVDLDWLTT